MYTHSITQKFPKTKSILPYVKLEAISIMCKQEEASDTSSLNTEEFVKTDEREKAGVNSSARMWFLSGNFYNFSFSCYMYIYSCIYICTDV